MGIQRTFSYKARDTAGGLIAGTMTAMSAEEVGGRLRSDGMYVLMVSDNALTATPLEADANAIRRNDTARRVKRDDVIAFSQQLGVMMETGVPLSEAIDSFRAQTRNAAFAHVLSAVSNDISAGEALSAALGRWPRVFPNIMISLMKASEASGTMSSMLSRVGSYLAKERRTARQIKGALSYPAFMLTVGIGITIFLVAVVLPRFARIYEQRSASLPMPTKILLGISEFFTTQVAIYAPTVIVASIAFFIWRRSRSGRTALDFVKIKTPILRTLFGQLYLTRATRTMSTLLAAGVNLLDIIDICRGVTNNMYWERLWNEMDSRVRNGRQLSEAVAESGIIPPNVVSMICAGEKAGRLSDVMAKVAEFADEELDAAVKQTTTFIEPIMICLMGVVVGGVAIALLMPIFTVGNVMAGK
ncbi:MAG: type II secretion system F family protein [Phycisphaerales bacterium]